MFSRDAPLKTEGCERKNLNSSSRDLIYELCRVSLSGEMG